MKVIITGGLGFIFSYVVQHFLENGYTVLVLDNLTKGSHTELLPIFHNNYPDTFIFNRKDVSCHGIVETIRSFDPDYIIHAAAISDVDQSITEPYKVIQRNNEATLNVFEAARQCSNLQKLLYISTDEVYGECEYPKEEHEILFPRNPYALSKAFGSLMRIAYDNTYPELKNKTCETRFCNVFGLRQDGRKILSAIKNAVNTGVPVTVHNKGEGFRQFVSVKEIPPLMELLLKNGTRTYNITSEEGYSVKELIRIAENITGTKIKTLPGLREGMDMRYQISPKRIHEEFGWKPKQDFYNAFKDYLLANEQTN